MIEPKYTDANGMLIFAIIGVAVNGVAALRLKKHESMNEKVLSWHLIEDVMGWVAILITSSSSMFWDIHVLDPILSLAIAAFILWNVVTRLRETMYVFLQGAPQEVDLGELKENILGIEHVTSTHHTHLWTLNEENQVFMIHVTVDRLSGIPDIIRIKNRIKELLRGKHVSHATIDIEFEDEACYMESPDH
ncbi:cation diffusion facilitator family transporter [Pontibacter rugosus]|uniref:Cation diffusion facilitator family transporter n=1 Tax=Pontibacter rugosus TaxID=1745966 RepID=A0ABW3SQZ4_9BACT